VISNLITLTVESDRADHRQCCNKNNLSGGFMTRTRPYTLAACYTLDTQPLETECKKGHASHLPQPVPHQDDRRRFLGSISTTSQGDAHISCCQGRGVIHTIPNLDIPQKSRSDQALVQEMNKSKFGKDVNTRSLCKRLCQHAG
jgi:hypothetical protein